MADRKPLVRQLQFEKSQLAKVNQGLRDAQKEINASLRRAGKGGISDKVTRLQAEQQLKVISDILDKNYDSLDKILQESQRAAAQLGSEVVSDYEETLTSLVLDPEKRAVIRSSEAKRVANNIDALVRRQIGSAKPLSARVYKTAALSKGMVEKAINSGLAQGMNFRQLANKVAPLIDPGVRGGVSYASQRLARTEINNAYHAASEDRYKHSFVEGVEWNLSSSHPEGDECDDYANESPYAKNNVPEKPHPMCFCFLTPALPSEEDFMKNLFDGKYDDGEDFGDEPTPTQEALAEEAARIARAEAKAAREAAKALKIAKVKAESEKAFSGVAKYQARPLEKVAAGTNPYGRGWPDYKATSGKDYEVNCTRVSAAYELRARGYDVRAAAAGLKAQGKNTKVMKSNWFDPTTGQARDFTKVANPKDMDSKMESYPEGSRFLVQGPWKRGGAHVWNAEVKNGKVVHREAQSAAGARESSSYKGIKARYQQELDFEKYKNTDSAVSFLRVDDLEPAAALMKNDWLVAIKR